MHTPQCIEVWEIKMFTQEEREKLSQAIRSELANLDFSAQRSRHGATEDLPNHFDEDFHAELKKQYGLA